MSKIMTSISILMIVLFIACSGSGSRIKESSLSLDEINKEAPPENKLKRKKQLRRFNKN